MSADKINPGNTRNRVRASRLGESSFKPFIFELFRGGYCPPLLVRLKARRVREVEVLSRKTLSGL